MTTWWTNMRPTKQPTWTEIFDIADVGAGETLPDDLSVPTDRAIALKSAPSGGLVFVDFDVADGAATLQPYGWLSDGVLGVPMTPIEVEAVQEADTDVYRSPGYTVDFGPYMTVAFYVSAASGEGLEAVIGRLAEV